MRQIRVWTQSPDTTSGSEVMGRVLLEARASQAVMVHGYKLDLLYHPDSAFDDDNDRAGCRVTLQTHPHAPTTPSPIASDASHALAKHQGNIGLVEANFQILGGVSTGHTTDMRATSGWIPDIDMLVPGLWMVIEQFLTNTGGSVVGQLTLLFDWVTQSPIQMAALYTTFGFDTDRVDREAVGEIDFSRGLGDGNLPSIVG